MKKILIVFVLSLVSFCYAEQFQLKSLLQQAQPGSYLVTQQGKTASLLHIKDKNNDFLVLEEATIPLCDFQRQKLSWKNWFEQGGHGHTLWTISVMNLHTGCFEQTYSYTHQSWIELSETNSFLATLMNLNFTETPAYERKKVGLPPGYGKPDHRALWMPRAVIDGHAVHTICFKAYRTRWPHDQSELSSRIIEIYLPEDLSECPAFFPYWLEVEGRLGNAKLRVIDSGAEIQSPRTFSPRLTLQTPKHPDCEHFSTIRDSYINNL
ncbi:MAG: hypothetical protein JSS62_01480 [Verrucomicrobia bacterium]|nr:hypothetical protein [Verrucomicrobiota bacterium]MBS0645561.1 hypothetical protein [Verrucomicrobiota bacterium]